MRKLGRKGTWAAIGMVLLLGLAIVPAATSAASTTTASAVAVAPAASGCSSASGSGGLSGGPSDAQWAYGGQGWSNWSISFHDWTFSYNSTFGWTVVFTVVSNSTTGVTMLSEQRTLGITVWANITSPKFSAQYLYHAFESDGAFANVTNRSTVYVEGSPVAALGLLNASVAACSAVHQALTVANQTVTRSGYLNVTGMAEASVSFSPSLGLIPLNLNGVEEWNSSSTATAAANWNIAYAFMELNGTTGSGSCATATGAEISMAGAGSTSATAVSGVGGAGAAWAPSAAAKAAWALCISCSREIAASSGRSATGTAIQRD